MTWSIGNGLLPLVPVLLREEGHEIARLGNVLAAMFSAMIIGNVTASVLTRRQISPAHILAIGYVVTGLSLVMFEALSGSASLQVSLILAWFGFGLQLPCYKMLVLASSARADRAKWLARLATTFPVGSIVGGAGYSALVFSFSIRHVTAAMGIVFITALIPLMWLSRGKLRRRTHRRLAPAECTISGLSRFLAGVLLLSFLCFAIRVEAPLQLHTATGANALVPLLTLVGGISGLAAAVVLQLFQTRRERSHLIACSAIVILCPALFFAGHKVLAAFSSFVVTSAFFVVLDVFGVLRMSSAGGNSINPRAIAFFEAAINAGALLAFLAYGVVLSATDGRRFVLLTVPGAVGALLLAYDRLQCLARASCSEYPISVSTSLDTYGTATAKAEP